MAADRPLAERGIVEFKMGRSKFPGKPSKIGNRKRVNLSCCALPEDNDSSKAAKNIYLGLSVFNETFGDNDMVLPGPFHGFSMDEVEEAMAEARLQQKESEVEHEKQGISINLWSNFQSELFSISYKSALNTKGLEVNKTNLSFDGGGGCGKNIDFAENSFDNSDDWPSKKNNNRSIGSNRKKTIFSTPEKKIKTAIKFKSPRLKLSKLQHSPVANKSLQSQAAKKLLDKAKMSNLLENNKNVSAEKKFILPSHSIHSSRIIKPNKRFFEENMGKRKFLRSTSKLCRKPKVPTCLEDSLAEVSASKNLSEEFKIDLTNGDASKKCLKKEENLEGKSYESKNLNDITKNNSLNSTAGKIILREPRLQLEKGNISLLEGPFSTPNSSSLSPNSQLKVNTMQSVTASGSIVCGVCGVVRFCKFVELAKKFGINCCEVCQKFITKILKSLEVKRDFKLQCLKNSGVCGINPVVKSEHFNISKFVNHSRCQACWLKLCLKNFKMPIDLKQKLLKLLPVNMQISINLEYHSISNDITNKFKLDNKNIKDFKWLNENSNHETNYFSKENFSEKPLKWSSISESNTANEKTLRKRTRNSENENKLKVSCQSGKVKSDSEEKNNRQQIMLKGPRVKHVCRSASVVLGQPLATFSSEASPNKKQTIDFVEDCKNCDSLETINVNSEPQGIASKSNVEYGSTDAKLGNKEKKSCSKEVSNAKSGKTVQQIAVVKAKKKTNTKVENPVSLDFWESYDPEEISETGFGLIGSEAFNVRALCFLCGSAGHEKLIHCASCCEPYHEFCVDEAQLKLHSGLWKYDWVCPRCTVCFTCGRTSGQQLRCVKCDNSYHIECVDRVGGRLLHSPDRPWVCSVCLRCKSCNGVDVSIFVGNLPLCKACFVLRQKGNYCPLCQRCYEDDDYDSKMMECGQCKCWVHAKCEGLSEEKYQVLSFLPESVEYVCRMCCVIPPTPWWLAVEAELKSGYLGVLKALSKNRKACTMLKWSPRKQCTCRQINFVSRALDFEDTKSAKGNLNDSSSASDIANVHVKEENKLDFGKESEGKFQPSSITERKTSIEVISHPTESLKLTLKIMKGTDTDVRDKTDSSEVIKDEVKVHAVKDKYNNKENIVRVKRCSSNEEISEDPLTGNPFDCHEDSQTSLHSLFKGRTFGVPPGSELSDKRSLSSPLNPPSDSGIGSTDDELKASCLTDEETCKLDEQKSVPNNTVESKSNCDTSVSFLKEKRECFCFLEVDSYNSRSKPFSPNLMSIKKKVTTSEYSSLHQFHQDMERMIATSHSVELMDLYHQTIKEIFPWFDPKFSRVQNSSQKVLGTMSLESTPVKNTPVKNKFREESKILREKLCGKSLDYFYSDYTVEDNRVCLMCKVVGDGPPGSAGRLLYCGQNEWVHCNCALWSGEVFEEIDGSLQNVHSAISRGRSIRCPECNLKGASIGCCARNCQETYHFNCARRVGCIFMDDKTMYCPAHAKESIGKLVQNENEFEIRRPVYVELDKRRMKNADSSQIRFAVGALQVNNLGKFILKLSDQEEAIYPEQFSCTRWFWSCREPWRIVRYHFSVRLIEMDDCEGVDTGINFTIDHSKEPELVDMKLKQLRYFQRHNKFLDVGEKRVGENREKSKLCEMVLAEDCAKNEEGIKLVAAKRSKKDQKSMKKIIDQFDSREDENCLSDNQNTADLLPPDIEEAIFKDLPHDILDGISMQDIFMDIKSDSYENVSKDGAVEDSSEVEDNLGENSSSKVRRNECNSERTGQNEFWVETTQGSRQELQAEDTLPVSKCGRDLKRSKSDEQPPNQPAKKAATLKTNQKSCNLNWNFRTDGTANKWKKNSKCHVTVNLLEPPERGNMLQELKFTDGLVTISTGALGSIKDLKSRLEENKKSIREEGKENNCLSWQTSLQPRLLQVDGGVDSSSSGSEAGESPQRLMDENLSSKLVVPKQSLSFIDSSSSYTEEKNFSYSPDFSGGSRENYPHSLASSLNNISQLDGVEDFYSDSDASDSENIEIDQLQKRRRPDSDKVNNKYTRIYVAGFKINQCDGAADSDCEEGEASSLDGLPPSVVPPDRAEDEPVKCSKCHCTYRTKLSYQRHLESCSNEFMLSSSEGEMSEEESPKKHCGIASLAIESGSASPPLNGIAESNRVRTEGIAKSNSSLASSIGAVDSTQVSNQPSPASPAEKLEVKKEKSVKRTYARKKPVQSTKKVINTGNLQQVQQILVQPQNAAPALIVQDLTAPNIVPAAAFIDSTPAVGYMTSLESQNAFGKTHLIAAPNHGIISGNFQFPSAPGPQFLGGLCLNSQTVQANLPGFVIQQPHGSGTLISAQPAPVVMPGEQLMMGSNGLYDLVQDPRTGGMFLTSYNQPLFYNMETIVSNTVMQTNQFVSNVLATTYSQTSTQIIQASEVEQVVNLPSNYIVVGPNPPTADRFLSTDDLICVQTPQALMPNQNPIQISNPSLFNPSLQTVQPFNAEPKILATQINPVRCLQPIGPSIVLGKMTSANLNGSSIGQPGPQVFQKANPSAQTSLQAKVGKIQSSNQPRRSPIINPGSMKSRERVYERAVVTPKLKVQQVKPKSRALVDYINNFKSDICDTIPTSVAQVQYGGLQNRVSDASSVPKTNLMDSAVEMNREMFENRPVPSTRNVSPQPAFLISPKCYLQMKNQTEASGSSLSKPSTPSTTIANPAATFPPLLMTKAKLSAPSDENLLPSQSPPATKNLAVSTNENHPKCLPVGQKNNNSESGATENAEIKSEDTRDSSRMTSFKVLMNKTNSFAEREVKNCLSMPSLDDHSPSAQEEDRLTFTGETSPVKDKNGTASEVLPLQENSQSINSDGKSNSPPKILPNDSKSSNSVSEERTKCKKKASPNDQNSLTTATFTAHDGSEVRQKKKDVEKSQKVENNNFLISKMSDWDPKGPKLIFDVISDDGYQSSSTSMAELWANICDSVQEMRATMKIPPLPVSRKGHEILGMQNHGLQHCLEQLKGVQQCVKYKCKYFSKEETRREGGDEEEVKENKSGCARTEKFTDRKEYDMFAWLASRHRQLPKLMETAEETLSSIRRANNLPMAMRYRNLKETAKLYVGVYRSKIHGRGLFCLRDIEAGEMVIEYAGEVIRSNLTDKREKHYTEKGIGCYMFRIDDHFVVDATMKGNAARFINHSCEPNCYSRVVDILGKKHIVIFALRRINTMEELTYDYKFPLEDEKISCHCQSKKCKKYLN